jgi:ParB-like chromosome segregation protein Spo0J
MASISKIDEIDTNKIIPYANNSRTHTVDQINKIRSSIREYGFISPVLVDEKLNLIAGHGRLEASKLEGMDKIPCVILTGLTDAQRKAYVIADNRMALDAGWDYDALRAEIEQLQEMDFPVDLTGFEINEIESMLSIPESIDLDDQGDTKAKRLCHCPKCGFEFEE